MRKLHKTMIVLFCVGVFTAGLGTGAACSEFSSFAYEGVTEAGPLDMKTDVFDCALEPGEDGKITILRLDQLLTSEEDIICDPSVPGDTIRFKVTYNKAAVQPYVEYSKGEYAGISYYYIADDLEILMMNKDRFLKDLKERKFHSYRSTSVTEVKLLVHPDSRDILRIW